MGIGFMGSSFNIFCGLFSGGAARCSVDLGQLGSPEWLDLVINRDKGKIPKAIMDGGRMCKYQYQMIFGLVQLWEADY